MKNMNKWVLSFIIGFGLIAAKAYAESNYKSLSPAEFFYGVSIESQLKDIEVKPAYDPKEINAAANPESSMNELSPQEFFYGVTIENRIQVEDTSDKSVHQKDMSLEKP